MGNLLSANFLRLRKSVLFWGLLAVSFGLGALIAFNYYERSREESIPLDGAFFSYPILACILTAVFIPLFLGREYSDGSIRSKVAAGHSRPLIYGANLLAGMAASALFCGAYMLAALTVGTPLIGFLAADAQQAALLTLGSLAAMAAFCALFTLAAMNCSRKSVSAVVCVLGVFLMLLAAGALEGGARSAVFYLAGLPYGLCLGVCQPLNQTIAVKCSPPERWGAANALYQLAIDVGMGASTVVWGVLNDTLGFGASLVGSIVCLLVGYGMAWLAYPPAERRWRR